jgi:hypothetical protein
LQALAPTFEFTAVIVFWHNTTDFFFEGVGTLVGVQAFYRGNYDTVNGVVFFEDIPKGVPGTQTWNEGDPSFLPDHIIRQSTGIDYEISTGGMRLNSDTTWVVDGFSQPRGIRTFTAASVNSGAAGAEAVVLSSPAMTFVDGRAYRFMWRGQTATTAAATVTYRIRLTALGGSLQNQSQWTYAAAANQMLLDEAVLVRTAGSNTTDVVVLTLQASAGTAMMNASTAAVRKLEVFDIGAATDYPGARAIV